MLEDLLQIEYHIRILAGQRYAHARQPLPKRPRPDLAPQCACSARTDEVIKTRQILEVIARHSHRVESTPKQVDFQQMSLAAEDFALLGKVRLAARAVGHLVRRAQ